MSDSEDSDNFSANTADVLSSQSFSSRWMQMIHKLKASRELIKNGGDNKGDDTPSIGCNKVIKTEVKVVHQDPPSNDGEFITVGANDISDINILGKLRKVEEDNRRLTD